MGNKLVVKGFDAEFRAALVRRLSISESNFLQSIVATKQTKKQQSDINELIDEYLKFMRLMQLFPLLRFSPSGIVDQVWHEHILFTREYRIFCKKHFGKYLNHAPTVEGYSIATTADDQRSYAYTLYFYALYFNSTPSTVYWPTDKATNDMLTEMKSANVTISRSLKIKNLPDKRRKQIASSSNGSNCGGGGGRGGGCGGGCGGCGAGCGGGGGGDGGGGCGGGGCGGGCGGCGG